MREMRRGFIASNKLSEARSGARRAWAQRTRGGFRLATIAGLLALGLIGAQVYALDTTVPQLRSLTESPPPPELIRKAA